MRPPTRNNYKLIAIVVIAMSYISLAATTAYAQWPYTTDVNPSWSLEMGARAFDRPGDDLALPLATNSVTNEVLFDSETATDLNNSVGVDLRLNFHGRHFDRKWEFRTIMADFGLNAQLLGPNLDLALLPDFSPDVVDYNYDSRLWSFELNTKRSVAPGLTFLFGPRFISLDEESTTKFEQLFDTDFGSFNAIGASTIETSNSLYGGQFGFEYNLPITQQIYFSTTGKVGVFANPAEMKQTDTNNVDPDPVFSERSKNTGAFLGEVNARFYCEIIPSTLSAFVGYDAMIIDGVAIAPAQFLTTDPAIGLETSNSPFFNSITFGVLMEY